MTVLAMCPVIGTGDLATHDFFRPSIADDPAVADWAVLSIEDASAHKLADQSGWTAIIVVEDPASIAALAAHPEVTVLIDDTRQRFKSQRPNTNRVNTINAYMTARGYTAAPTGLTWEELVHFFARQINPAAVIDSTK